MHTDQHCVSLPVLAAIYDATYLASQAFLSQYISLKRNKMCDIVAASRSTAYFASITTFFEALLTL